MIIDGNSGPFKLPEACWGPFGYDGHLPRREGCAMKALYYGDNLQVLRDSIATESVDLIYLDPPLVAKT